MTIKLKGRFVRISTRMNNWNRIFMFAPCINGIKNTFYCSKWCALL